MDILGGGFPPQSNRDNQKMNDISLLSTELREYLAWGGQTIVDQTLEGLGRDALGVQQISRRSGVNIVLGAGYYIELSHPARLSGMSADDIADEVVRDLTAGHPRHRCPGGGHRGDRPRHGRHRGRDQEPARRMPGIAPDRSPIERPHQRHVPARDTASDPGHRRGGRGRHPTHIIDHASLRPGYLDIHLEVARRGAYLGYDTISSDFNWGSRGSGKCDYEIASEIRTSSRRLPQSCPAFDDLHMKIMLTAYGGGGYGYLLREVPAAAPGAGDHRGPDHDHAGRQPAPPVLIQVPRRRGLSARRRRRRDSPRRRGPGSRRSGR